MKSSSGCVLLASAVLLASLPACKKNAEQRASQDLGEAGYQLTAEDFFRASRGNDVEALKRFTSGRIPIDTRDAEGNTALHAAATAGSLGAADYLLDHGLSIDTTGKDGRTALMDAVIANQTQMTAWLLRQGANPHLKDKDGFKALMLATREGSKGSVAELSSYDREDLDAAVLLAALLGRADIIDSLTNYGGSVYARMEDGRTPLMVAAENGHEEAVKLLLEIGASRLATDPDGRTAADLAGASGHTGIANLINHKPTPGELGLESPEQMAASMDRFVDDAVAKAGDGEGAGEETVNEAGAGTSGSRHANAPASTGGPDSKALANSTGSVRPHSREASRPLAGAVLSAPVASDPGGAGEGGRKVPATAARDSFPMPPLVMRLYRERLVPVAIRGVRGDSATVAVGGSRETSVRSGDTIPGTTLSVVRVRHRMEDSKVNLDTPAEISVVEVRDTRSGVSREWITGMPSEAHDPAALVEDAATGKRYIASPGQTFSGADGSLYEVSDVRPNQMVIREKSTGAARTIPLRGPRG